MTITQSHQQTITSLQTGIERHFREIHATHAKEHPDFKTFLARHLLFITAAFAPRSGGDVYVTPSQLQEFGLYYFSLHRRFLGSSLDRKLKYQSITYAFLDYEGSRAPGTVQIRTSDFPHVHALMLAHPAYCRQITYYAGSPLFWTRNMDSVVVKRFAALDEEVEVVGPTGDLQLPSLQNLIGYSMKGFTKASPSDAQTDFLRQEFPKRGYKTTWVRRDSPGSPVCGLQAKKKVSK